MDVKFIVSIDESKMAEIPDRCGDILVTKDNEKIGAIEFLILPDQILITDTNIYPEYQRQGYGSQALECVKGLSRFSSLPIIADAENVVGLVFYKKNGFKRIAERTFCTVWVPEQLRGKNEIIVKNI